MRHRTDRMLAAWLFVAPASSGATPASQPAPSLDAKEPPLPAVSDVIRAASSAQASERERAVFQLGDLEAPDAAAVAAVVAALDDPEAAVRWNAFAALRKIGPAATAPLLARIGDDARGTHVGTYSGGCFRDTFVPTRGDMAAAALALGQDADADAIWTRYVSADPSARIRLAVVASLAKIVPRSAVLRAMPSLPPEDREFLLRLAANGGRDAALAIAEGVEAMRRSSSPEAVNPIEREALMSLATMGADGREARLRLARSSVWPESVFASSLAAGDDDLAAASFRAAALSGRSSAMADLAAALRQRWVSPESPWIAATGKDAVIRFLGQALPADAASRSDLVGAAQLFARLRFARPLVLDLAQRFMTQGDAVERGQGARLFMDLAATSRGADDDDALWAAALSALAAAPPRGKAGDGRTASIEARRDPPTEELLRGLPIPREPAQPALAQQLVSLTLERRISPHDLAYRQRRQAEGSGQRAQAWAAALLAAARAAQAQAAGAEQPYAALLGDLQAPSAEQARALWTVVGSQGAALPEMVWALRELGEMPSERRAALERLSALLRAESDAENARLLASTLARGRLAGVGTFSLSEDESERLAAGTAMVWTVVTDRASTGVARKAAADVAFAELFRLDAASEALWMDRAVVLLDDLDPRDASPALAFLADHAPDPVAADESCIDQSRLAWRSTGPPRPPAPAEWAGRLARTLTRLAERGGADEDLIARVWRGFELPGSAIIDPLLRAVEARADRKCPAAGTRTSLHDLEKWRSLPEGYTGREQAFRSLVSSRSPRVVCAALEALPAFGRDSVAGTRDLLLWLALEGDGSPLRGAATARMTCAGSGTVVQTMAGKIGALDRDLVHEAVRQAVAWVGPVAEHSGDRTQPDGAPSPSARQTPAEGEWAPLTRRAGRTPTFQPDDGQRRVFELEGSGRSETGTSSELATVVAAMPRFTDDVLVEHLARGGRPTRAWSALAAAWWLEPRDASEPWALEWALRLLRVQWPALRPEERLRALPLLGAAPVHGPIAAELITFSLTQPAAGERAMALELANRQDVDATLLASTALSESVSDAVRSRLQQSVENAFDDLYPPGMICIAGRGVAPESLPPFPWPPPAGYRTPEPLDLAWFGGPTQTAEGLFDRLKAVFAQISPDYEVGLFSGPPGGFALVARLERIDASGTPFSGRARWTTHGRAKFNLAELLGDLFLEKPGYFRVVTFVVTDVTSFTPQTGAVLPDVTAGAQVLPDELARMPLQGKHIFALVYSFERPPGQAMRAWVDGSPSTRRHLEATGLWERIATR